MNTMSSYEIDKGFQGGVPEMTLFVTSACNLRCEGCIMGGFMKANNGYDMSVDELNDFLAISEQSGYSFDIIVCGGEPLLWKNLKEGLRVLSTSKVAKRILIFSNIVGTSNIDDEVMNCVTQLRVSKYRANASRVDALVSKYPTKILVVDRTKFYRQASHPLQNVLPCNCLNVESMYMNRKVYACPHGPSLNEGKDTLTNGEKLYAPLEVGYMQHIPKIRDAIAAELCTRCSSNPKVRLLVERYLKKDKNCL